MGRKILIGPSQFGHLDNTPLEMLRDAGFDLQINPYGRKLTKTELIRLLHDVDGLIAGLENVDREVVEQSYLKVISRCGSGITNIDLDAVKSAGIRFYFTPDGPTQAVAELTIGMMITLMRSAMPMNAALHQKQWEKRTGHQLKDMSVLIIGFGRIGRAVAGLLKPFRVHISIVDPKVTDAPDGILKVSVHDGLRRADVISIHASGEQSILGKAEFDVMKSGVYILNSARGGLLDESLLLEGLKSGRVAGAWLDSFSREPYHGPLCGLPNVILTPHVGSYTQEGRKQMEMETVRNLISGFEALS